MAKPMAAQDTFSVQLKDGSSLRVSKGEVFPDTHEVVKLDAGRGLLFKPLDFGEAELPPPKSAPPKSAPAKAEPAKAEVKAEPKAAPVKAEPKAPVKASRPAPGKAFG